MFESPCIAEAMRAYVLDTAPVLALCLDASLCVTCANAQARKVLPDGFLGRPFAAQIVDFAHELDLPALIRQEGVVNRLTLKTVSGMPETIFFRFFPLPAGTLALGSLDFQEEHNLRNEMLGLNRELNNMTRQLHQANAELRELNELKNRFIGMAAHDLRKPVGIVMTYSEFILDEAEGRLTGEQLGFLRTSLAAATGMKRLIDNFLDVSVIEAGHLRLETAQTGVSGILAGVLPLVSLIASRKKVKLVTGACDCEGCFEMDAAKIQQVLVNLVGNAVEHSKPGQQVWISVNREDTELIFSVRDEGAGIAAEDQKLLFSPFVRAGTRKTAGERSVGLGLAIAHLVVEAHGGRIWVESVPGSGATFLFALPIREKQQIKESAQP